ncbi:MAG TPA: 50S ribosomal protein L13 [Nitrososphaerales archaeon]
MQASATTATVTVTVIDAAGMISGRLCSKVAKLVISGNKVIVVNAEKAVITGSKSSIKKSWEEWLDIASITNPLQGPYHPRNPDRILQRMVRGMLPMRKSKGPNSMKRLRIYNGVPAEFSKAKMTTFDDVKATKPLAFYTTVGELAKLIGWKGA